jgi:hypothetical protein
MAEVNWLRRWITGRLNWIDSQGFPEPQAEVLGKNGETRIKLTGEGGEMFYTLDGSDPRVPGGAPSTGAREYSGPIALSTNTVVTARVRSAYGLWSAPVLVRPRLQ